jgi:diaminopropionate ammonia-lyase
MDPTRARRFFAARPQLTPTPLVSLPSLARDLGLEAVHVKDETHRFGLTSFKAVGVQYAIGTLVDAGRLRPGGTVTCATAGNHGRAVAHIARREHLSAVVFVPGHTSAAVVAAIEGEGATVIRTAGSYEDAVARMAASARARGWMVISDTSWPGGDDEIPQLIMEGYLQLFLELERGTGALPVPPFLVVQAGVGGLAAAAVAWAEQQPVPPRVIVAEPARAACVRAALEAGAPVRLEGPLETEMSGLRCAEVSRAAWPWLQRATGSVTVTDREASDAVRRLEHPAEGEPRILGGLSGACGVAALPYAARLAAPATSALAIVTEGRSTLSSEKH